MFTTLYPQSSKFGVKKLPLCLFFILNALMFLACSSHDGRAPVDSMGQPGSHRINHHVVAKGDTLYSIAWRYNLDYKHLAKINKISAPYRIFPGRKVILKGVAAKQPYQAPIKTIASPRPPKEPQKVVAATTKSPASTAKSPTSTAPEKRLKENTKNSVDVKSLSVKSSSLVWSWPVHGQLISSFNSFKGLNKGIDIAAKLGESVLAATDGKVVYAGSGLRGYGKLIIVKHENSYLSAYAHNRKLLVKEGEIVKRGQKIAEVGASGTTAVKLHFEIRRDGTPIDPVSVLPRK